MCKLFAIFKKIVQDWLNDAEAVISFWFTSNISSVQSETRGIAHSNQILSHSSPSHRGTTIGPINERLDIINTGHHLVHHGGGCSCCCVHYYGLPPMSSVDTQPWPRTPLHDARRRSLEQGNVVSVFPYGDDLSSEPVRLFRKNNLNSRPSDNCRRSWRDDRQDQTMCNKFENRFGSSPVLNSVPEKSEDRAKKSAYRKIGRVTPFVAHKEEEEDNDGNVPV